MVEQVLDQLLKQQTEVAEDLVLWVLTEFQVLEAVETVVQVL